MFWCYPVWLERSAFLYPSLIFFTFMPRCKHVKHCSRANICRYLMKPQSIICYVWFAQLTSVRCAVFWHTAASRKDVKISSPAGKCLENTGKRAYSCKQEFADMLRLAYFSRVIWPCLLLWAKGISQQHKLCHHLWANPGDKVAPGESATLGLVPRPPSRLRGSLLAALCLLFQARSPLSGD